MSIPREFTIEEKVADLKGSIMTLEAIICVLIETFPHGQRQALLDQFEREIEGAKSMLLNLKERSVRSIATPDAYSPVIADVAEGR